MKRIGGYIHTASSAAGRSLGTGQGTSSARAHFIRSTGASAGSTVVRVGGQPNTLRPASNEPCVAKHTACSDGARGATMVRIGTYCIAAAAMKRVLARVSTGVVAGHEPLLTVQHARTVEARCNTAGRSRTRQTARAAMVQVFRQVRAGSIAVRRTLRTFGQALAHGANQSLRAERTASSAVLRVRTRGNASAVAQFVVVVARDGAFPLQAHRIASIHMRTCVATESTARRIGRRIHAALTAAREFLFTDEVTGASDANRRRPLGGSALGAATTAVAHVRRQVDAVGSALGFSGPTTW